ncbi:MAG TPA: DUF1844 domain-containing protein [Pyrinomonadaceae bacterium]|nr:DUF1844 domain-containing protein [Pyrinomonadaceae bacterium]
MNHQEENQEEVVFKITDRRKFNPDGSLKEGVTLEAPKPENLKAAAAAEKAPEKEKKAETKQSQRDAGEDKTLDDFDALDDPASFTNFLSTLATNAAAALGAVPHPVTAQRTLDLDTGKFWIDILAMLKDKTKGNLSERESRLLDTLLADLRMQYVTMVKATEEKLKAQAAKKFSSADILGKKR